MKRPAIHQFAQSEDGAFPNSRLPALVYKAALPLPSRDPAAAFEALFLQNAWGGSWRNGLFSVHHYHSTAHEVLGVYAGSVRVQLGGERGAIVTLATGDVAVIPAGLAHKNVGASGDFKVVGAYPLGTSPDMQYGKPGERPASDRNIARVPLPSADPVDGRGGSLVAVWTRIR
jgi:uncharacterized protein YjlB